jgi:hypothetical protein
MNVVRGDHIVGADKPKRFFASKPNAGNGADRAFRYLWRFMSCHLRQRLERSVAIERLERLEQLSVDSGGNVPDMTR